MTTAPSTNSRASLLSGLRTGGVRSVSSHIPHTAAPGATFNIPSIPRTVSHSYPEEEEDQVLEMPSRNIYANNHHGASHIMPMTAAVDGHNNRFAQQQQPQQQSQQRGMNPNSTPFNPAFTPGVNGNAQQQAFQMQMMQLELLKLQAAQQYQAQLMAQAQAQQPQRRASFNPPATAGPLQTGFDIHSATVSAQLRRASEQQQQLFGSQLGIPDDYVPMTAALGGRFGSRTNFLNRAEDNGDVPVTHGSTTIISGGTSLGGANSNVSSAPSKSDAATSWRRGGKGNSVLNGANRAVTSPSVKVTPPETERSSPPLPNGSGTKARPQPLRFTPVTQQPLPIVTIDSSDGNDDDAYSTSSSKSGSNSSPTTPQSGEIPLSPREEASKKLYEGLGMGRPGAQQPYGTPPNDSNVALASHRLVSQATRQPRGPPSGADELGPKNFATRIRRKAIGGLGMLMDARERREVVDAF
jgi:hypothetical protein